MDWIALSSKCVTALPNGAQATVWHPHACRRKHVSLLLRPLRLVVVTDEVVPLHDRWEMDMTKLGRKLDLHQQC